MLLLFVTNQTYTYGKAAGMISSGLLTVLAFVPVLSGLFWFQVRKKDGVSFGMLNMAYYLLAAISFSAHFNKWNVIMVIITAAILAIMELRCREEGDKRAEAIVGKRIFQIALFVFLFAEITTVEFVWDYTSMAVPAIVCLLYGFIKKKTPYKIVGFVYAFIFLLIPIEGIGYGLWGGAIVVLIITLVYGFKEQYQTWMKGVSYPFFLVYLIVNLARLMDEIPLFPGEGEQLMALAILAGINICMMKIPVLRRNPKTGKDETGIYIETGIIHILQMLLSLGYVKWIEPVGWHWFAILLGFII